MIHQHLINQKEKNIIPVESFVKWYCKFILLYLLKVVVLQITIYFSQEKKLLLKTETKKEKFAYHVDTPNMA